jgi:chromosome segregation ATPase
MTDDLEDSGQWRDSVETRLGRLEVTVEEQARLRAAMDEDFSKLHVERKLLQAMRDTQQDHTAQLREHGAQLREHGAQLREHGAQLKELREEMRAGFGRVQVGVEAIRDMLDRTLNSSD